MKVNCVKMLWTFSKVQYLYIGNLLSLEDLKTDVLSHLQVSEITVPRNLNQSVM